MQKKLLYTNPLSKFKTNIIILMYLLMLPALHNIWKNETLLFPVSAGRRGRKGSSSARRWRELATDRKKLQDIFRQAKAHS
jgi:hypothetical protein